MPKDLPDFGSMYSKSGRGDVVPIPDSAATEIDVEAFKAGVLAKLALAVGKDGDSATARDWFVATALALRDRVIHRWLAVNRASRAEGKKHVYYLSLEFLIGRLFADVVENLRLTETVAAALGDLGVDLDRMRRAEPDAALGNGGLGRLAACLMESMASLGIPGLRLRHPLRSRAVPAGDPRRLAAGIRRGLAVLRQSVGVRAAGSRSTTSSSAAGSRWRPSRRAGCGRFGGPDETIEAVAYDTPIVGWRGRHVNPLRLWSARAVDPLRLELFNEGDHVGALSEQARAEAISKVLYPERQHLARPRIAAAAGVFLRLRLAAGHRAPPPAIPTAICRRCRSTRRSSSTTRIRASPSPN